MSRETPVNVLLGLFLLFVFAVPFLLGIFAIGFAVQYLDLAFRKFVPALARPWDVVFYGILCLWSLISGVGHLRKWRWRNAFLSLAIVPMIISIWLAGRRLPFRDNAFFAWPWFLVVFASTDSLLTRLEFTLGGILIGASVGVSTGLLGSGTVAQVVADCIFLGAITLLSIHLRRLQRKATDPEAPALTRA